MRGGLPRRFVAALATWALLLAGCGPKEPPPAPPGPPESVTFSQIMIVYGIPTPRTPGLTRTREQAREVARDLLRRVLAGEPMETLILRHTDDLNEDGTVFNDGSYSKAWLDPRLHASIRDVVFFLKPGQVHPELVDSGHAWHVLRRDR